MRTIFLAQIVLIATLNLALVGCTNRLPISRTGGDTSKLPVDSVDGNDSRAQGTNSNSPTQGEGTADHGGGNGIDGKLLESYRINDLVARAEFKAHVQPIIDILKMKLPALADKIVFIFKSKNIYIVPKRLDELPRERVGVTFSTEQYARQSVREIWVDEKWYKSASVAERGKLWIHELAMALMFYSKYSLRDHCINTDWPVSRCGDWGREKSIGDSVEGLSVAEVAAIRTLARILLDPSLKDQTASRISAWLDSNGFGFYFVPVVVRERTLTLEEFYKRLRHYQLRELLPTFGGFGETSKAGARCEFVLNFNSPADELTIDLLQTPITGSGMPSSSQRFHFTSQSPITIREEELDGKKSETWLSADETKENPVEGTVKLNFALYVDQNSARAFEFSGAKSVYTLGYEGKPAGFAYIDNFDSNGFRARELFCLPDPVDANYEKYLSGLEAERKRSKK